MQCKPSPSQVAPRFIIRFPDGLREQLKLRAAENDRSMNAEIVRLIKKGIEVEDRKTA